MLMAIEPFRSRSVGGGNLLAYLTTIIKSRWEKQYTNMSLNTFLESYSREAITWHN